MYLGDFKEDGDIFFKFSTRAYATGIPTTLAGTPVLSVYKDEGGAASEKTTAETYFDLDVDHDSIAGWHNVRIDLSGDAFFATGADYAVVITTGTVSGVNVFGENIATFSIENRSMGQPAGATLAADIAALKVDTAATLVDTAVIGTLGAGLSDITLPATGLDLILKGSTFALAIADAIADEVLTGATHNVANSLGKRIRTIDDAFVIASGTAQAGAASTITLASGESATNDIFQGDRIAIVGGTGEGEHGICTAYNGSTKVATVHHAWVIQPDNTSEYELTPADVDIATWEHTAVTTSSTSAKPEVDMKSVADIAAAATRLALTLGSSPTGTVDNSAHTPTTTEFEADDITEATADHFIGRIVLFTGGILDEQATDITDYALVGSNGHFTVTALTEAPGNNDPFIVI